MDITVQFSLVKGWIAYPIHQAHIGHDEEVDFEDQASLGLGWGGRTPYCDTQLVEEGRHAEG